MALELVCGADFWCNRHCKTSPVVLEGFWGQAWPKICQKPRKTKIPYPPYWPLRATAILSGPLEGEKWEFANLELSPGHPKGAKTGPPPGPPTLD